MCCLLLQGGWWGWGGSHGSEGRPSLHLSVIILWYSVCSTVSVCSDFLAVLAKPSSKLWPPYATWFCATSYQCLHFSNSYSNSIWYPLWPLSVWRFRISYVFHQAIVHQVDLLRRHVSGSSYPTFMAMEKGRALSPRKALSWAPKPSCDPSLPFTLAEITFHFFSCCFSTVLSFPSSPSADAHSVSRLTLIPAFIVAISSILRF